jgi:hypothetical protein
MSTTRLVGLLIVHGRARCPSRGSVITARHKGEEAVAWVYGLDHNGESGDKRGKDKAGTRIQAESTLGPNACFDMVYGERLV